MNYQNILTKPISETEKWVFSSVLILLFLGTLYQYYFGNQISLTEGGDPFAHAEWLMSFAGGPVRRGFGGEFVFLMSDFLDINPLTAISVIQVVLLSTLIATLMLTLNKTKRAPMVIILLANPAFVVFWMFEFRTHGKEILACLCFAPLLLAAFGSMSVRLGMVVSAALFLVSGMLHEATVFFAPALCMSVVALHHGVIKEKGPLLYSASILASCFVIIAFAKIYATADAQKLCNAITDRNLSENLCRSHIRFNSWSTVDTINFVIDRMGQRPWLQIIATFILAYLPVFYSFREDSNFRTLSLFVLIAGLSFSPLYVLALDYGRWMNMQISAVTLMILTGACCGWIKSVHLPPKRWIFYFLFGLGLTWRVGLIQGGISSGVVTPLIAWM